MSLECKLRRVKKRGGKGGGDDRKPYYDKDGNWVVPLSENAMDILKQQKRRFIENFRREPGPNDPVFFDADFDKPAEINPEKYQTAMVRAMRTAGVREAVIHAYEKTGLLVTAENRHLIEPNDLAEWEAAFDEYDAQRIGAMRKKSGMDYKE